MKKILTLVTSTLLMLISTLAVTLEWCPSPDVWVTGYKVHYGTNDTVLTNWWPTIMVYPDTNDPCSGIVISNGGGWYRTYTDFVDAGNTNVVTITNLVVGSTYYITATAYTADGLESPPSNEVSYTVPEPIPLKNTDLFADDDEGI